MQKIINYIKSEHKKDLSVFADAFLQKAIDQRVVETLTSDYKGYLSFIISNPIEIDCLFDSLNISYSIFFRNPFDFTILERFIMPELYKSRSIAGKSVRIWSAACAEGQEAYSIAMIADDLTKNKFPGMPNLILATDISERAISKARKGEFLLTAVQNIKFSYIQNFFFNTGQVFMVNESIKQMVEFTPYDLLDKNTTSPPSGIFGGYDIVICCNLLIYYKSGVQENILRKLYNSLCSGGYLMVDESERSIVKSFNGFKLFSRLGNIFVKSQ